MENQEQTEIIEEKPEKVINSATEIKLFGKWSFEGIKVKDQSLEDQIAVRGQDARFLPHSAGRWNRKRFRKIQCPIVERLTNSLMMHGRNNGKKLLAVRIVKHCFEIIYLVTGENPIQVAVNAIANAGPREDTTRVGKGGVARRQSVDVSPLRRVNMAIGFITSGARTSAFRNTKTIAECLADEIILAAQGSLNSSSMKKKNEIERVARSNR